MRRTSMLATAIPLAVALSASAVQAAHTPHAVPAYIGAAVTDRALPQADTRRDAERKPAETLAFAGVKPGDHAADLAPGKGYFTRLLSAVVGPNGKVIAIASPPAPDAPPDKPKPAAAVQAIAADPHYSNVTVSEQRASQLALPEPVDLVWTSQNYHDFHNVPNIEVANIDKAVFNALKPGGLYIVLRSRSRSLWTWCGPPRTTTTSTTCPTSRSRTSTRRCSTRSSPAASTSCSITPPKPAPVSATPRRCTGSIRRR